MTGICARTFNEKRASRALQCVLLFHWHIDGISKLNQTSDFSMTTFSPLLILISLHS